MQAYTEEQLLSASKIGFEFEFLIKMDPVEAAQSLSDALNVRVLVPMNVDALNKPKVKYHTPVEPTSDIFKLESDYSGGKECHELITGPMPYNFARTIMVKVFKWITANGWTTDRCSVHANISFDNNKIKTLIDMEHLNVLKFCLNFDEKRIYKEFPNRINSIYANSIKNIITNNIFYTNPASFQMKVPEEKYYGVNFQKAPKGYLEFRYIGCKDYEKRTQIILDLVDYFITYTYTILQHPDLSSGDTEKMKDIIKKNKLYLDIYKDPMLISKNFPELYLMVDLKSEDENIKTYWPHIKDRMMDLMIRGGVTKGNINYDTDNGKIQVKDAKFNFCNITGFELINCTGYGYIFDSSLTNCNFTQVILNDCNVLMGNHLKSSKIHNCNVNTDNVCEDCYIENERNYTVSCKVIGGIFRKGTMGKGIDISKETSVIDSNKITNDPLAKNKVGVYANVDKNQYKETRVLFITKGK
jgi:hypothetical protein